MKQSPDESSPSYSKITHAQRLNLIYLRVIHRITLKGLVRVTGIKYNTVRNILRAFKNHGRTNKKTYDKHRKSRKAPASSSAKGRITTLQEQQVASLDTLEFIRSSDTSSSSNLPSPSAAGAQRFTKVPSQGVIQSANLMASFDKACSSNMCGLRLFCDSEPAEPLSSANQAELGGPCLKLKAPTDPSVTEVKDGASLEVIVDDVGKFGNERESLNRFFCGELAFLNEALLHRKNKLQMVELPSEAREALDSKMRPF